MATKKRPTKARQQRRKAQPSLFQQYMQSPTLAERVVTGQLPLPGPSTALGGAVGIARFTGQSLAGRAIREAAQRMAQKPAPATPVSPWVRRAQGGNLPTKDMTTSRAPRPDVFRGVGDIVRTNPQMVQSGAAELTRMTKSAVNAYNRERQAMGMRPIDFPGNTGPGSRSSNKAKPKQAAAKTRKPAARRASGGARTQ